MLVLAFVDAREPALPERTFRRPIRDRAKAVSRNSRFWWYSMNRLSGISPQSGESPIAVPSRSLRQHGMLFRSLFMNAPAAMVLIGADGAIELANRQAESIFAFTGDTLVGRPVIELLRAPAGEPPDWHRPMQQSLAAASPAAVHERELIARRRDGDEFPVEVSLAPLATEEGVLISAAFRDITELKLAADAMARRAHHDALTGLPNRVLFLERLDQALARAARSGRPLAVIFLDLDDFKLVNDSCGHDHGDLLLKRLTPRLVAAVRAGDTVARLGGDEFVALCEDLANDADAVALAQRVTDAVGVPVRIGGYTHNISVSAGVIMVRDPAAVSAQAVLRDADAAMYSAKAGGKCRVAVFDEAMRAQLLERFEIEAALRRAVSARQLRVYFQPVVKLEPERVVAAEALVRWQHPERGLLAPADFIPVAERAGLLGRIGEWVIVQACRQAVLWRDQFPERRIPVSVNISGSQLKRGGLADFVQQVLDETGLDPWLLELEVTESALREDEETSRHELRELKAPGTRLIVDDFGAGYSSLAALRDLGIDGLKLDRSFVQSLGHGGDEGELVKAVLSMAGAIDADVTAEGVETSAQVSSLRTHGCDFAQGYLFARPGPACELTALLAEESRQALAAEAQSGISVEDWTLRVGAAA
jgi:diguanylate cyclase (GGDEF)-like protein/PAS domain S-box-containing protein